MTPAPPLNTPPPEDMVAIVLPPKAADTPAVAALIKALCDSPKRLSVGVMAPDPAEVAPLASRFPRAYVYPPGPGLSLARLRVRVMLYVLPDKAARKPRSVARAIRRGIPVFGLPSIPPLSLKALSLAATEGLPESNDTAMLADHLISAMGFERGDGPVLGAFSRGAQRMMHGPAHALMAPLARRFASLDALSAQLGQPQVIMCLGNGPSSADPVLKTLAHDALFRVNHQWMHNGYMTGADVIFAGVKRSMRAAGSGLVGVASLRKEQALLGTRLLTPWRGRLRYVVVEEIADLGNSLHGHPRPTTGAVMLAAAIALAPQRLIVAGMDMFADKSGAYPGQPNAVNAYAAAHDRNTDAEFIRTHLARYHGEIMTLSPAFTELAHSVAEAGFTLVNPAQT